MSCCKGLPAQPQYHADDCPTRAPDYNGLVLLRENSSARINFDYGTKLCGGDPLAAIASALDVWAAARSGGSFEQQCYVMSNECRKASAELAEYRRSGGAVAEHGWVELDKADDLHFKNGHKVLGKDEDGEVYIMWWEDRRDHNGNVDTVTYRSGWVTGDRDTSGGRATDGRYLTSNPKFVRDIPK